MALPSAASSVDHFIRFQVRRLSSCRSSTGYCQKAGIMARCFTTELFTWQRKNVGHLSLRSSSMPLVGAHGVRSRQGSKGERRSPLQLRGDVAKSGEMLQHCWV